jgi:hypothetical protein
MLRAGQLNYKPIWPLLCAMQSETGICLIFEILVFKSVDSQ